MPRRCANVTMLRKENENTIAIIGDDATNHTSIRPPLDFLFLDILNIQGVVAMWFTLLDYAKASTFLSSGTRFGL